MDKDKKVSMMLQEMYGDKRIVIGRRDGLTYIDIPEDPETYADLMIRLLKAVAKHGLINHFDAYIRKLDNIEITFDKNIN